MGEHLLFVDTAGETQINRALTWYCVFLYLTQKNVMKTGYKNIKTNHLGMRNFGILSL